jgi:hypothetical protein
MVVLADAAPVAQDAPARFAAKGTRSGGAAQAKCTRRKTPGVAHTYCRHR